MGAAQRDSAASAGAGRRRATKAITASASRMVHTRIAMAPHAKDLSSEVRETADEWTAEFIAALGSWTEEIERPHMSPIVTDATAEPSR